MMKYSSPEYQALEREFLTRPDALCEHKNPLECDCKSCRAMTCASSCAIIKESAPFGVGDRTGRGNGNTIPCVCPIVTQGRKKGKRHDRNIEFESGGGVFARPRL